MHIKGPALPAGERRVGTVTGVERGGTMATTANAPGPCGQDSRSHRALVRGAPRAPRMRFVSTGF